MAVAMSIIWYTMALFLGVTDGRVHSIPPSFSANSRIKSLVKGEVEVSSVSVQVLTIDV